MYGSNVPCAFTTSKGSTYTVETAWLICVSYRHDGKHEGPKNIFYCDEVTSDELAATPPTSYRVEAKGSGTAVIKIESGGEPVEYKLVTSPVVDLYPVDMILESDGRNAQRDRFHVGDQIDRITTQPPAEGEPL